MSDFLSYDDDWFGSDDQERKPRRPRTPHHQSPIVECAYPRCPSCGQRGERTGHYDLKRITYHWCPDHGPFRAREREWRQSVFPESTPDNPDGGPTA